MKFSTLAILILVASAVSDHLAAHDFIPNTEIQVGAPDLADEVTSMQVVLLQSPLHSNTVTDQRQSNSSQVETADTILQPQPGSPMSAHGKNEGFAVNRTKSEMQDRLWNFEQVMLDTTIIHSLTVHLVLFVITLGLTLHTALLYFAGKPESQHRASGAPHTASGAPHTAVPDADLRSQKRHRSAIFRCSSVNWRISSIRLGSTR